MDSSNLIILNELLTKTGNLSKKKNRNESMLIFFTRSHVITITIIDTDIM